MGQKGTCPVQNTGHCPPRMLPIPGPGQRLTGGSQASRSPLLVAILQLQVAKVEGHCLYFHTDSCARLQNDSQGTVPSPLVPAEGCIFAVSRNTFRNFSLLDTLTGLNLHSGPVTLCKIIPNLLFLLRYMHCLF